jgi:inosine-uridine nucleoside N-ribohydrolase
LVQKVILDVDTGGDDAVAILLAGHHPALELVAVTVTHGNAPLPTTLENTLRTMQVGKLNHIPVYSGASQPLVAQPLATQSFQYELLPLPPATLNPQKEHAARFLVNYYNSGAGSETIYLPVGPQTNLALALQLEPALASRIPRIVTMGGAFFEGNTTPSAEFNILADPEAASIVFNAGIPITMVGLEVTAQALITTSEVEKIRAIHTPWADAVAVLVEREIEVFKARGWSGAQIFDACAVAAVIDPGLVQTNPMRVDIELGGSFTRGRTVADVSGRHRRQPNVDVAVKINRDRFIEELLYGLQ